MVLDLNGWAEEPETTRRKAGDLARRALLTAQNDPRILANAASALAYVGEDIGAMMALADRALAINPSYVRGWYLSGVIRLWAGQLDLVIEHIETTLRLSPREHLGLPLHVMGMAYLFKGQFDKAVTQLLLSVQEHRGYSGSYRGLAACYAHMGRFVEAREIVTLLGAITSQIVPSYLPYRRPEHRELLVSGLRLAANEAR